MAENITNCPTCGCRCRVVGSVTQYFEPVEAGRWVPVKERLPDKHRGEYLVAIKGYGKAKLAFYLLHDPMGFKGWIFYNGQSINDVVTHWAELPPPPYAETKETK